MDPGGRIPDLLTVVAGVFAGRGAEAGGGCFTGCLGVAGTGSGGASAGGFWSSSKAICEMDADKVNEDLYNRISCYQMLTQRPQKKEKVRQSSKKLKKRTKEN